MSEQLKNIPMYSNGNQAVGFMGKKEVGKYFEGYFDNASLNRWYQQNPNKADLGILPIWNKMEEGSSEPVTLFDNLVKDKAVMEVNGFGDSGSFSYERPIENETGTYTEDDMSDQEYPGIDGNIFYVSLSKQFAPGTTLTTDDNEGQNIIVAEEEPVESQGSSYLHPVRLVSQNKNTWYKPSLLVRGVEYFTVSHYTPEYGRDFAQVEMPDTPGTMKFEYRLGSITGVESFVTGQAASKSLDPRWTAASTQDYIGAIENEMDAKNYGEFVVRMDMGKNGPDMSTVNIGKTVEFLTKRYLRKLIGTKLMFQQGGLVPSGNGTIRINEGLWPQAKRGRRIEYGRPGGITEMHIREAAEYVFRGTQIPYNKRQITFKCGTQAYHNVLKIFEKQVFQQLNTAKLAQLMGSDRALPSSPVKGQSLTDLVLEPVEFTEVFLPNIGRVSIEWDPSLDYGFRGDRYSDGMNPQGMASTTYSMIIWDASSQDYSNNRKELPKNTKLVEGGNKRSNVYLVKPEGRPMIISGKSTGRYDSDKSSDIVSSMDYMAEKYWCYSNVELWLSDPSKVVMIELSKQARKSM